MDLAEYAERQHRVSSGIVSTLLRLLNPFRRRKVTPSDWNDLLRSMYREVESGRRESAKLGREFYDSQRALYSNVSARWDMDLATYRFEWFKEALEPSKQGILRENTNDSDLAQLVQRATKEVENGARKTILRAVQDEETRDPEVKAWARVATGRETCGFCMMLISRGPVYFSAEDAGLDLDDTSALDLIEEGDETALDEAKNRWHPGCDCKVVPVFDRKNWEGRDAYLKAEELWKKATSGYRGKDALNALRRALERGDLDAQDFSVAA